MPSDITFATDQDSVKSQFYPVLNSVALVLKKFNQTIVDVYGHTDSTGDDTYNYNLSQRRALAVANYLSSQGVDSRRFAVTGFGETRPIADNGYAGRPRAEPPRRNPAVAADLRRPIQQRKRNIGPGTCWARFASGGRRTIFCISKSHRSTAMLDSAERRFGPRNGRRSAAWRSPWPSWRCCLFWPAGTLSWALGWWFIGVFTALTLVAIFCLWRVNPEIFAARSRFRKEGSKGWDVIVATLTMIAVAAILPVAALDDKRFGWAPAPGWAICMGYVLLVASYAWVGWAQAVNRHFEPTVRIQTERGHKVIDTGPYAFVRHPGYIGAIVLAIGIALALGSLWALVPAAVAMIVLAGRTLGEEAVLKAELPGYADYMQRVRYRWVPRRVVRQAP